MSSKNGGGAATPSPPSQYASPSLWYCIFTCCLFGFGSGSMTFFNKGLVSSLGFHYSAALLTMQQLTCVCLFHLSSWTGVGSWGRFTHPLPRPDPRWGSWTLYVRLAPLSLFSCGNAMAGMWSLQGLSLPMFSVLKRFTPIVVAVVEWQWLGRRTSRPVALSLLTCMLGFLLAGLGDLVFDLNAYTLALVSCCCQALYLITVERTGRELGMQSHELLYYNALLSLLILLPLTLATGELHKALFVFDGWASPTFLFCLGMMLLLGMSLNYCQFLCTQVNSPLTTCMVGVVKGLATTIAGFFMFGGQPLHPLNLTGVALSTLGSSLYAWAKFNEKKKPSTEGREPRASAMAIKEKGGRESQLEGGAGSGLREMEDPEAQELLPSAGGA